MAKKRKQSPSVGPSSDARQRVTQWLYERDITPAVRLPLWLDAELETLLHNVRLHVQLADQSTKQHRDQRAELALLSKALKGLSYDTKQALVSVFGVGEMMALGTKQSSVIDAATVERNLDVLQHAADAAQGLIGSKRTQRGRGRDAAVRRYFVQEATRLFVWAGGQTLSASPDGFLHQWCELLLDLLGQPLPESGTGLQRAICDAIGTTQGKRDATRHAIVRHMERQFPA